jgi:hypothetical protein
MGDYVTEWRCNTFLPRFIRVPSCVFVFAELDDIFPASMELKSISSCSKEGAKPHPHSLITHSKFHFLRADLILSYPRSTKWFVSLLCESKIVCILTDSSMHATFSSHRSLLRWIALGIFRKLIKMWSRRWNRRFVYGRIVIIMCYR